MYLNVVKLKQAQECKMNHLLVRALGEKSNTVTRAGGGVQSLARQYTTYSNPYPANVENMVNS